MTLLVTALGFIAMGQTIALLIGGIDLSVGPLAGFLVVVGSFFLNDESSGTTMVLGLLVMLAAAAFVGLVNGSLIRFGKFTAGRRDAGDLHRAAGLQLPAPGPAGRPHQQSR